jgi:hypothetical protein
LSLCMCVKACLIVIWPTATHARYPRQHRGYRSYRHEWSLSGEEDSRMIMLPKNGERVGNNDGVSGSLRPFSLLRVWYQICSMRWLCEIDILQCFSDMS